MALDTLGSVDGMCCLGTVSGVEFALFSDNDRKRIDTIIKTNEDFTEFDRDATKRDTLGLIRLGCSVPNEHLFPVKTHLMVYVSKMLDQPETSLTNAEGEEYTSSLKYTLKNVFAPQESGGGKVKVYTKCISRLIKKIYTDEKGKKLTKEYSKEISFTEMRSMLFTAREQRCHDKTASEYTDYLEIVGSLGIGSIRDMYGNIMKPEDILFFDSVAVLPPDKRVKLIGEDPTTNSIRDLLSSVNRRSTLKDPFTQIDRESLLSRRVMTYTVGGTNMKTESVERLKKAEKDGTLSKMLEKTGTDREGIAQKYSKGKESRIRSDVLRKLQDMCMRAVITPCGDLKVDEVGVPRVAARELSYPEKVTTFNIHRLQEVIGRDPFDQDYPDTGPALAVNGKVHKIDKITKQTVYHVKTHKKTITLELGDIVERQLQNGDIGIFNRQPSIHKGSLMGHFIRIFKDDVATLRLAIAATTPYNADMDGDAMVLYILQSGRACIEGLNLTMLTEHLNGNIGLKQDDLCRVNIESEKDVEVEGDEFKECVQSIIDFGYTPRSDIVERAGPKTSFDLISMCLPATLHFGEATVKTGVCIEGGCLIHGEISGKDIGPGGGLLSHMVLYCGTRQTADTLDRLHAVLRCRMSRNPITISLTDCMASEKAKKNISGYVERARQECARYVNIEDDLEREAKISMALDNLNVRSQNAIQADGVTGNGFAILAKAGSKGSIDLRTRVSGCLSQQLVKNKRVMPSSATERTFPSTKHGSYELDDCGFCPNGYVDFVDPRAYFIMCQKTVMDIYNKTGRTAHAGVLGRIVILALDNLVRQHDYTVRNSAGHIIQFGSAGDMKQERSRCIGVEEGSLSEDPAICTPEERKEITRSGVHSPMSMKTLIQNVKSRYKGSEHMMLNVDYGVVARKVDELIEDFDGLNRSLSVYIRSAFTLEKIVEAKLKQQHVEDMLVEIRNALLIGRIIPGECIGADYALMFSKVLTQLVLNSVRPSSGGQGGGNVLQGINDMTAVLNGPCKDKSTREKWTASIAEQRKSKPDVPLAFNNRIVLDGTNQDYLDSKESSVFTHNQGRVLKIIQTLQTVYLSDVVEFSTVAEITVDGAVQQYQKVHDTVLGELGEHYVKYKKKTHFSKDTSVIRLLLKTPKLVMYGIDIDLDIISNIEKAVVSQKLIVGRTRAYEFFQGERMTTGMDGDYVVTIRPADGEVFTTFSQKQELDHLLQKLKKIVVKGCAASKCEVKVGKTKQYPHDSSSRRFLDNTEIRSVVEITGVDMAYIATHVPTSVISEKELLSIRDSNPRIMMQYFGIDAGKHSIEDEIANIYQTRAAERPPMDTVRLLADRSTHTGAITSLRYKVTAEEHGFGDSAIRKLSHGCSTVTNNLILREAITGKIPHSDNFKTGMFFGGKIRVGTEFFDLKSTNANERYTEADIPEKDQVMENVDEQQLSGNETEDEEDIFGDMETEYGIVCRYEDKTVEAPS